MTVDDWLAAVVATPGLTGIRDLADARRALVEDSLRALDVVSRFEGPIVDVGSRSRGKRIITWAGVEFGNVT